MLTVPLSCLRQIKVPASQLQAGDALLFQYREHQSVAERGIRLVTGSVFVHIGTVERPRPDVSPIVMEQLSPHRLFEELPLYTGAPQGTEVHALRPRFPVEPLDPALLVREPYGYLGILDSLLNHGLSRVTLRHWRYRAMLGLLTPDRIVCSALAAKRYRLDQHTDWAPDFRVVEPDDYVNHHESFDYLGQVAFGV